MRLLRLLTLTLLYWPISIWLIVGSPVWLIWAAFHIRFLRALWRSEAPPKGKGP